MCAISLHAFPKVKGLTQRKGTSDARVYGGDTKAFAENPGELPLTLRTTAFEPT
jgi:hypothetical protein